MGKLTRKLISALASRPIISSLGIGLAIAVGLNSLFDSSSSLPLPPSGPIEINVKRVAPSEKVSLPKTEVKAQAKNITALNIPESQVLSLTGVVGMGTDELVAQIFERGQGTKPLYLLINSPGGSVLAGAMIISAMESSKVPIYTVCMEICASMAAMIFEHGTERYIVDRALLMFHPASTGGGGPEELDKTVSRLLTLQRYIGKMETHVAHRAGMSFERYKLLSGSELWIDGEDAVNGGFADKLISLPVLSKNKPKRSSSSDNQTNIDTKVNITW